MESTRQEVYAFTREEEICEIRPRDIAGLWTYLGVINLCYIAAPSPCKNMTCVTFHIVCVRSVTGAFTGVELLLCCVRRTTANDVY